MVIAFLLICQKARQCDPNILMSKLKHYSRRGLPYTWFEKEKKMFQSMDLTRKICQFLMVLHLLFFKNFYFDLKLKLNGK